MLELAFAGKIDGKGGRGHDTLGNDATDVQPRSGSGSLGERMFVKALDSTMVAAKTGGKGGGTPRLWTLAVSVPLAYALFGAVWILASDLFLESLRLSPQITTRIAVAKGWIFVAGSTLLIGFLIRRFWMVIDGVFDALRTQLAETAQERNKADRLAQDLEKNVEERTEHLRIALAELGHFADSVSHDLRAPVRSINGFSRILLDEHAHELSPEARGLLERIESSGARMNRMIDGLLDLARQGRHELSLVDMDARTVERMVSDIWQELSGLEGGRNLVSRFGVLPAMRCDPRLLESVWRNLLGNAIKYSRVSSPAVVEVWEEDGWIHVRDNGIGFDPAHFPDIFQPFRRYRASDTFEGEGIGLALVRRIVERHGGMVAIDSAEGRGTTVRFRLPAATG